MNSKLFKALKQTVTEFMEDNVLRLSAALAYYSVFSLAPLLLIAIAIAGAVVGDEAARGQLADQLKTSFGPNGANVVQEMVAHAQRTDKNFLMSVVGMVMLLLGAGGVFGELQEALNTVWGVKRKSGGGAMRLLKTRFLSFSMVLGIGFLLLTSMILTTLLEAVGKHAAQIAELPTQVWAVINSLVSFGLIALLFAAIFKILPDARVKWRNVWIGAIVTAALFVAGKYGLSWYLGREATTSSYGSAGSLVLVLLWVHYSSMILLFGAEFTQVWANVNGEVVEPSHHAVRIDERA